MTDSLDWHALARPKTYEMVLERIEERILSGHLRVGDRLPPERDLAAQLGVSRSSIREAVRILQAQGVLTSGVGTGPDAGTVVTAVPAEALSRLLRLHLALASFDLAEIVDARVTLEVSSARLAAVEATADDLRRIDDLLSAMEDPALSRTAFNDLDTAFHVEVARAGHNRLVGDVTVALRHSLQGHLHDAFERLPDWAPVRAQLMREHRAIQNAVERRDPEAAATFVEAHIRGFATRLLPVPPQGSAAPDSAVHGSASDVHAPSPTSHSA